jgi:hypothetical protein
MGQAGKIVEQIDVKIHSRNSATTGGSCDGFRDGVRELVLAKRL